MRGAKGVAGVGIRKKQAVGDSVDIDRRNFYRCEVGAGMAPDQLARLVRIGNNSRLQYAKVSRAAGRLDDAAG